MRNNGTLLHEVTLKISTNDCLESRWLGHSQFYSGARCKVVQVGSPTFRFVECRHNWTFSGLWMFNADVWLMFCSSLSKELVHFCAIKYFWLDFMWEKWLCNNGNYQEFWSFRTGIPSGPVEDVSPAKSVSTRLYILYIYNCQPWLLLLLLLLLVLLIFLFYWPFSQSFSWLAHVAQYEVLRFIGAQHFYRLDVLSVIQPPVLGTKPPENINQMFAVTFCSVVKVQITCSVAASPSCKHICLFYLWYLLPVSSSSLSHFWMHREIC